MRLVATLSDGLLDPDVPAVHVDDLGFTRGDGCFEGCRVQTSAAGESRVDKLDRHLARMTRSAAALEISFDADQWRALIATALPGWTRPGEATMRLLLTRGRGAGEPTGLLLIEPMPDVYHEQRRSGIGVITLDRGMSNTAFATTPWLLGGVKTISYAVNMAAQREAARRGADDVIFVSSDGWVLEAPTGSVVWSVGRTLSTPPPGENGILAGTTQQLLFAQAADAGWQTTLTSLRADELHEVDAIWLIGSVRGPVEVAELDGKPRSSKIDTTREIQRLAGF